MPRATYWLPPADSVKDCGFLRYRSIGGKSARAPVLILCHRDELIDQIVGTLEAFEVAPHVIAASYGNARTYSAWALSPWRACKPSCADSINTHVPHSL